MREILNSQFSFSKNISYVYKRMNVKTKMCDKVKILYLIGIKNQLYPDLNLFIFYNSLDI